MSDVAQSLAAWAADRFRGPVRLTGSVEGNAEGFDSEIQFLQLEGDSLPPEWRAPLVLRIKSTVDYLRIARHEAEIHDWLHERNYPVPRILAVIDPGEVSDRPVQVVQRAPGVIALDALKRRPWRYGRLVAALAQLARQLHAVPVEGFPDGDDIFDRRLSLTRQTAEQIGDDDLRSALAAVEGLAPEIRAAGSVAVCHGDFHPLNVLVDGDRYAVIDWTDAGIGDHHADVARTLVLFGVAEVAAGSAVERVVLRRVGPMLVRRYRAAYEALAPLDDRRLALWTPVHLLHGWSQAAGVVAGSFSEADGARAARLPEGLIPELGRRFDEAMAAL